QVERAGTEKHGDQDKADRDLVGDHLCGRAQRAEKRVTGIRGPAGQNDPIDAERADGKDVQDSNVDIGDDDPRVERDDGPGDKAQRESDEWCNDEYHSVRGTRDHRLLDEQFEPVGKGLKQTERADHVWPLAKLRERQHLALGISEIGDSEQQWDYDGDNLADGYNGWPSVAGPEASHAFRSARIPGQVAAEDRSCCTAPSSRWRG